MADKIQEFPKSLYHKDAKLNDKGHVVDEGHHQIVNSAEEQEALGSDYLEGPEFVGGSKAEAKPAKKSKKSDEQ